MEEIGLCLTHLLHVSFLCIFRWIYCIKGAIQIKFISCLLVMCTGVDTESITGILVHYRKSLYTTKTIY